MAKTNKQIQVTLDIQKYEDSKLAGIDLSGQMFYCAACQYRDKNNRTCTIEHKERAEKCACAKALKALEKCKKQ